MADCTRTVVTAIGGGLGNQMFQYAVGRRLAHVNNAPLLLYLEDRFVGKRAYRPYGLGQLAITGRQATHAEAGGLRRVSRTRRRLSKVLPFLAAPPDPEVVREENLLFNPAILSLTGRVKLTGAWQCERYFSDIASIIREEFSLRGDLDDRNREALARIEAGPSAFLHVRRGDYVTHPKVVKIFGTCSPDYYREAVRILHERAGPDLRIFVFSDDPAWVREMRIGGEGAEIVDWNADRPERDLALMRRCRHAVIANSSFSWWGAWLGDDGDSNRIVIAPRVWLIGRPDYRDIVPERWLKLG